MSTIWSLYTLTTEGKFLRDDDAFEQNEKKPG